VFDVSVPGNRISILYVDDEQSLLDLGKKFLERGGLFDVDTALSAAEALALLQKNEYDGIISDYQMPEMDGIELLKNIRSRYPDLPFIIFTGKGREEIVIEAFDAGADYYVQKGGEVRPQFRELSHKITLAVEKRRVEKALKVSQDQYRNVVEDQTEFISRFLPDGTHNFVNEAYCRYFGMQKENIVGHRFIPQIPNDDARILHSHFASLTFDNPSGLIEHRIILPDGSVRWQLWSDRAIFDESGTLVELQSVGRDITDRKTAELDLARKNEELCAAYEQLAATEEELRSSFNDLAVSQRTLEDKDIILSAIIEESPIPQFVIDRNHKILYWNHALVMNSGIVADEVTGTDTQWKAFYPAKRPCLADLLVDDAVNKIPEWYRDKYAKSVLINDAYEGTDFFPHLGIQGKWLHFTAGLIKNRKGDIIGAVESLEDITTIKTAELNLAKKNEEISAAYQQLKATEDILRQNYEDLVRSEQALRESNERYRNVVEDQNEFICRFTPEGRLSFVNDAYCRYFGLDKATCIGTQSTVVIPPEDLLRIKVHLAALSPENPTAIIEHRIILPSGDIRWQRWSDRAIYDKTGSLVEYQSVGKDVTDRVLTVKALYESNKKLNLLFNITRHDIISQLTVLLGYLELSESKVTDPQLKDWIKKAEQTGEVIKDQILFTREFKDIGMHDPFWQNVYACATGVCQTGGYSKVAIDPRLKDVEIIADPHLRTVFQTLFENAGMHGGAVTRIEVSGQSTPNGFDIIVEDNGTGIRPEDKEKIFRKGFGSHAGFGLFLAQEILTITSLSIQENGEFGKGARFIIHVPKGMFRKPGEHTPDNS
jgi:PAS domain S-box-containing protein